jgi:hypothetical protein
MQMLEIPKPSYKIYDKNGEKSVADKSAKT